MENNMSLAEKAKKAAECREFFPLPMGQLKIYMNFKSRNLDYSQVADIKGTLVMEKSIDPYRLAKAVEDSIKAHPIYSAIVVEQDGIPGFMKSDKYTPVEVKEVSDADFEDYQKHFFETIRAKGSALYHFHVVSTPTKNYLFQKINHTISDLSSTYILANEIASRYVGKDVEPEMVNLFEYISYKCDYMKSDEAKQITSEFDQLVSEYLPEPAPSSEGAYVESIAKLVSKEEINCLRPLSRKLHVSATNCMLACIILALMRLTNKSKLLMGAFYHGRYTKEFMQIHGCLAHALPVMAKLPESGRVDDYLTAFEEMQNLIMNKYINVTDSILDKYSLALREGGSLNIAISNRPLMIDGTETKTIKNMPTAQKTPLYIGLNLKDDCWMIQFMSTRFTEDELTELAANARQIILAMTEKELISEL